jgi:hypothetical protein
MHRRAFLAAGAAALAARAAAAQYQPQGRDLLARLTALQTPAGALLQPGAGAERRCDAAGASLAVYGALLGAPPRARDEAATLGRRWLEWSLGRLTRAGLPTDFAGPAEALRAVESENADAAAGALLTAALAYYEQTGDAALVLARWDNLVAVAEGLGRLRQKSGLTHAAAARPVARLENNVWAWLGLDHFARLCSRLRKREETREFADRPDEALTAIDRWLWTTTAGHYAHTLHPDGRRETGLEAWAPNRRANLMAIAVLPPDERRAGLRTRMRRAELREPEAARFEEFVWWAQAGVAEGYAQEIERWQVRLARAPWADLPDLDPALVGHCLRVGKGRLRPAE